MHALSHVPSNVRWCEWFQAVEVHVLCCVTGKYVQGTDDVKGGHEGHERGSLANMHVRMRMAQHSQAYFLMLMYRARPSHLVQGQHRKQAYYQADDKVHKQACILSYARYRSRISAQSDVPARPCWQHSQRA